MSENKHTHVVIGAIKRRVEQHKESLNFNNPVRSAECLSALAGRIALLEKCLGPDIPAVLQAEIEAGKEYLRQVDKSPPR